MIDLRQPLTKQEEAELLAWLMQWDRNAPQTIINTDEDSEEWTTDEDFDSFEDVKDFNIPMTEQETDQLIADLSGQ